MKSSASVLLGRKTLNDMPKKPTRSHRTLLVLCWIPCLFFVMVKTAAAQGVCDRTPQVRDKLVELAGVSRCEDVTAGHLARVTTLDLSHSDIVWLHNGDFEGLSQLRTLNLSRNYLKTLPEEIFHGLNSLAELFIHQNKLSRFPEGVFNGLGSLQALWLQDNSMNRFWAPLPLRVFDDVLDTLEDLRVDSYLMSNIAFESIGQSTVAGYTVRVRVNSTRVLPVAFRVPYSVEWTVATADDARVQLPSIAENCCFWPVGGTGTSSLLSRKTRSAWARRLR